MGKQLKKDFLAFLRAIKFPEFTRNGTRGSTFVYPEWLIMLIAVPVDILLSSELQELHDVLNDASSPP